MARLRRPPPLNFAPNATDIQTPAPFYNIIWELCTQLAAAGLMRGPLIRVALFSTFRPPWMQFGNDVVNILLFRWGILSRDYVPKRWPFGASQNGGTWKSVFRARISLFPPEIPWGLDAAGCWAFVAESWRIATDPYDHLSGP